MKARAPAALAALAAGPALAHSDAAVHMHGTDATLWLVIALFTGLAAAHILRR